MNESGSEPKEARSGVLDGQDWVEHCEKWGGSNYSPFFQELRSRITRNELFELTRRLAQPRSEQEERACVRLFYRLLKDDDPRLGEDARQALSELFVGRIEAPGFADKASDERVLPREIWAMSSGARAGDIFVTGAKLRGSFNVDLFSGMITGPLNRRGGETELASYRPIFPDVVLGTAEVSAIDLTQCEPGVCQALVAHLRDLATPRAIEALRQLELLGGEPARRALRARQILGDASQEPIEALAMRWRSTKDGDRLSELYHRYLDCLPIGTPMAPWLERLGAPDTASERMMVYSSRDGRFALYLELDAKQALSGLSLKDY